VPAPSADPAAPQGPPPPRPAIQHPYLTGLVGTWDLAIHTPHGDSKGTAIVSLGLDGTALVEEVSDDHGFAGLGVYYVTADGKGLRSWWFDTMGGGEVWVMAGTLADAGYDLGGDGMGGAKATTAMHKDGDGHRYEMKMGGQSVVTIAYTKAAAPAKREVVARENGPTCPLVDDLLGDWTIEGVTTIHFMGLDVRHTGTSSFRLGVGGAYLLLDYEAKSEMERTFLFGVLSFGADGKSAKYRWFTNSFEAPIQMNGTTDGTAWTFVAKQTVLGDITSVWTKKDGALHSTDEVVLPGERKLSVRETHSKKK